MTIVDLRGQKLDLISKCCHADIEVKSNKSHIYYCNKCGWECAVVVSEKDVWSKEKIHK